LGATNRKSTTYTAIGTIPATSACRPDPGPGEGQHSATGKITVAKPDLTHVIQTLIKQESLPDSYTTTVRKVILPLAQHVQSLRQERQRPVLVGINGAQGTGKSTLTLFLQALLSDLYQVPTASFSIDDLYLTRAEREQLAMDQHPLLLTRGVPGTHDLTMGQRLIDRLTAADADTETPIPVFDKSRDDRAPESAWPVFQGRAEVVLVEGWCVGALPEDGSSIKEPINRLENDEDADGAWRGYVNQRLKNEYAHLFGQIDCLTMLKAPSMECVLKWRTLQEHKLRAKMADAPKKGDSGGVQLDDAQPSRLMTDEQIIRFIMHYERITRACLAEMPARADAVIHVDDDHSFSEPLIRQRV
jgi:D-glycerate 3-kinase